MYGFTIKQNKNSATAGFDETSQPLNVKLCA